MSENDQKPVMPPEYQAAIDAAVERLTQRERDLALYGRYIEVDGKRVDPMTVHYERFESPPPVGKSLIQSVREQISDAAKAGLAP